MIALIVAVKIAKMLMAWKILASNENKSSLPIMADQRELI